MFDLCAPVLGIYIYISIYIIYFDCPDSREYSEKKSMNVFLYDDIWEVGFLDIFFLSRVSLLIKSWILVWNNTAGIGIFIKFANTEFTDEAHSS